MKHAAFKLRYEGNKPYARLDIDIWKDGKKTASASSIGDLFYSSDGRGGRQIEVMIAVDTVPVEGKEELRIVKVNTIDDKGSSLATFTATWDKRLTSRGLLQTAERTAFKADAAVHVEVLEQLVFRRRQLEEPILIMDFAAPVVDDPCQVDS
ncbi:hypothetical protein I8J30_07820 [Paenibacillus sp. DLE-14]|uniref:Uncharacterized protein n=1 Tax=Paenibacillus lignilyticus TaxID=1172615 RepID=A0ABS5C9D3_9BACL|nr:hypothetical protein [Paenibacillus lignilyticus]